MKEKFTYHDLAAQWQVSVRTIARWVRQLRRAGKLKTIAPTCRTIRLTAAQCDLLESSRTSRLLALKYQPDTIGFPFPAKIPAKKDGESAKRVLVIRRKSVQKRPKPARI